MNYLMVKREIKTLSEDLNQMAEAIMGPEPAERKPGQPTPGHIVMPKEEVKTQLEYIVGKLGAVIGLIGE